MIFKSEMRRRGSKQGFSLVEVTLALGILSFTMVSFMGVLTVGLGVQRKAVESDSQKEIMQQLLSQVQETPYSSLTTSFDAKSFYFLNDGTQASSSSSAFYTATGTISSVTTPGATTASSSVRQLTFQITGADKSSNSFAVSISDNGN
jgi:uncharacterized protein (TIGR02598 family)